MLGSLEYFRVGGGHWCLRGCEKAEREGFRDRLCQESRDDQSLGYGIGSIPTFIPPHSTQHPQPCPVFSSFSVHQGEGVKNWESECPLSCLLSPCFSLLFFRSRKPQMPILRHAPAFYTRITQGIYEKYRFTSLSPSMAVGRVCVRLKISR